MALGQSTSGRVSIGQDRSSVVFSNQPEAVAYDSRLVTKDYVIQALPLLPPVADDIELKPNCVAYSH